MAQWFCVATTMMFNSMAFAVDTVSHTGFDTTSWLPAMGWGLSGGDYSIVVHGDRFVMAETEKVKRFDELRRLLREAKRKRGGTTARRAGQIADVRAKMTPVLGARRSSPARRLRYRRNRYTDQVGVTDRVTVRRGAHPRQVTGNRCVINASAGADG